MGSDLMRTVYAQACIRFPLGKQGENEAVRVVWPGIVEEFRKLYGNGAFTLTAKRCGDAEAYPVAVSTEGGDVVWLVRAADVASPGSGSCELTYTVDGVVAKSQTWSTYVTASISGDAPGEPPEEPAKAWFAAIQAQIGNLDDLTTKARANLVAAINEAAKSGGSGGGSSVSMRVDGGYIQYSTDDGETWVNLIALADLKGEPGQDGAPGKDGTPGADGYSPTAKVEAAEDGAKITITDKDGTTEATVKNGKDGADGIPGKDGADGAPGKDGTDGTNGITPTIGDNGNWYLGTVDTGKPSRGAKGDKGDTGADGKDGAGMDITGATVGQIAKISAVDENGKPTKWEPVDMASGGGGETWEKLVDASLSEPVESVTYTFDNCKRVKALIAPVIASGEPFSGWTQITINNVLYPLFNSRIDNMKGIYIKIDSVYPPYVQASIGTNSNTITYGFNGGIQTTALENIAPNGVTEFGCQTAGLLKAGAKIEIWGVKS